jgi:hypothetical protein
MKKNEITIIYIYINIINKMSYSILESSFCKNCDNFMDITNSISNTKEVNQLGGDEIDDLLLESSDYDVSITETIGGATSISGENISDENISDILDGSDTNIIISKKFDINDLNKNPIFNKLSNDQKTLVINRILEKNPKHKPLKSNQYSTKESYFYCKSCGYNEKILNKKFIFSRGNENKNELYNYNFLNFVNDNTLPRTKNYNCINIKCTTHKNPSEKMAVFYRHLDSYNIRYICMVCNNYWNNYNESKNI